jgi:hypothetical protein
MLALIRVKPKTLDVSAPCNPLVAAQFSGTVPWPLLELELVYASSID